MCVEWNCHYLSLFHLSYSCLFLFRLLVLPHYLVNKDEYKTLRWELYRHCWLLKQDVVCVGLRAELSIHRKIGIFFLPRRAKMCKNRHRKISDVKRESHSAPMSLKAGLLRAGEYNGLAPFTVVRATQMVAIV